MTMDSIITAMKKFSDLNLRSEIMDALDKMGYKELTPIQESTFEHIINNKDIIGLAETGSGKTSACVIPIIQKIDPDLKALQALILVPTRELALQYVEEVDKVATSAGVSCFAVYGGTSMEIQTAKLRHGVQVLVATPGRLIDFLYNTDEISLREIVTVVLDEADELLKMGFEDDVRFIISCIVKEHQTLLFSATMSKDIEKISKELLTDPMQIKLTSKRKTPQSLSHYFKSVHPKSKVSELKKYYESETMGQSIIFCNSRDGVSRLYDELKGSLGSVDIIHGGLDQNVRTSIFSKFQSGKFKHIIATDIAGRGLDFSKVTHVINYDIPRELENYTHRTGRAGRMGRKGVALSLISNRDHEILSRLFKDNSLESQWLGKKPDLSKPIKKGYYKNNKKSFKK
jgi:ATP-dependent RNA helicase DeaD